ncbi:octopamine receptor oamb [Culex quinquefasciatus]|uniref:Octopamine receptor oamb n=1 Tax=Culex quinquefasciatus TaxID=7176 RepID=B0X368_CULQU|nr:octopamine receptor oamb [Culex quinquefasciatus]|eukprot:XP_001864090.1 octopamine receptor oamb [Culex quinquefasciatus]
MMTTNATDYYWELSQLIRLSNFSYYNVSAGETSVTLDVVNCCTTEPNFSRYLEALPNDRAGLLAFLFLFSFATVFGNSLVILAVIRERYLHTATNYFVTSLAVADCLVGLVVMPFSALYEVLDNTWFFGEDWCDIWRSLDVLFSTASILNLCVISLDRYWAITDPFSYPMKMTRRKAAALIAAVWICSSAISFPAIVWWRAAREGDMPAFKCTFTEHLGYLVFSSTISFYLPLLVMVFTYCRIYRAAAIQTRSLKLGTKQVLMASGELQLTLRIHRGGTTRERPNHHREPPQHHLQPSNQQDHQQHTANSTPEEPDEEPLSALQNNGLGGPRHRTHMGKNFSLSRKLAKFAKEKKAAKTLGIVMGVFIVCWLPFFVVNLLSGFCIQCIAHEEIVSAVVTWLGWINSSMNPVIYACWSRDFRRLWTLDSGLWTLDSGLWTLDSGLWTLDSGLWTLDSGLWTLDSGLWTLDSGPWTLDSGLWTLDSGLWTLDPGLWTLDSGLWTLDSGPWTLDSGLWTLDSGLWTLDSGLWTLDS